MRMRIKRVRRGEHAGKHKLTLKARVGLPRTWIIWDEELRELRLDVQNWSRAALADRSATADQADR